MLAVCEKPAGYKWRAGREPRGWLAEFAEKYPETYRRLYHPDPAPAAEGDPEGAEGMAVWHLLDHMLEHTGWLLDPTTGECEWYG